MIPLYYLLCICIFMHKNLSYLALKQHKHQHTGPTYHQVSAIISPLRKRTCRADRSFSSESHPSSLHENPEIDTWTTRQKCGPTLEIQSKIGELSFFSYVRNRWWLNNAWWKRKKVRIASFLVLRTKRKYWMISTTTYGFSAATWQELAGLHWPFLKDVLFLYHKRRFYIANHVILSDINLEVEDSGEQ